MRFLLCCPIKGRGRQNKIFRHNNRKPKDNVLSEQISEQIILYFVYLAIGKTYENSRISFRSCHLLIRQKTKSNKNSHLSHRYRAVNTIINQNCSLKKGNFMKNTNSIYPKSENFTQATQYARNKSPSSIAAKKYIVVKHFNSQK